MTNFANNSINPNLYITHMLHQCCHNSFADPELDITRLNIEFCNT